MEATEQSTETRSIKEIPGTVPCPLCSGLPFVNPFQKYMETGCAMCGDTGKVDPERVCNCGRPARFSVDSVDSCALTSCMNSVKTRPEPELEDYYDTVGWGHLIL